MKVTYHKCDFCGSKVPASAKMASLTVPLDTEEEKLRQRCEQDGAPVEDERRMNIFALYDSMLRSGPTTTARAYDMCLDCARGLLRMRMVQVQRKETLV